MFGQNPVRHDHDYTDGLYRVQAVFYTIQGEGPFVGYPSVFIRLAGCPLTCEFCDTDFESGFHNVMTPENLFGEVERLAERSEKKPLIVITGGEPLIQNLKPLLDLVCINHHAQIETSGVRWQEHLMTKISWAPMPIPGTCSIVVSPKTPKINHVVGRFALAYKYVVAWGKDDPKDGLPLGIARPDFKGVPIFVQPMDVPHLFERQRNIEHAVEVSMKYGYRLSLQTHKILGLE